MQRRRRFVVLSCTLLLSMGCAGGASFYSVRFGSNESLLQQREKGLTLYTATRTWNGKPEEIKKLTTPIAVELRNDGPFDTVVLLPHFVLVDDKGRRYRPLTVYTDPPVKREVPGVRRARAYFGGIPQIGETWSEEGSGRIADRRRKVTIPAGAYRVDELPTEGETWHKADRSPDPELEKLELTVTEKTAPIDPGPAPDGPPKPGQGSAQGGQLRAPPPPRSGGGTTKPKVTDPKKRFAKPSKIKFATVPEEVVLRRLKAGGGHIAPKAPPTFRIGDISGFGYGFRAGLFVERGQYADVEIRHPNWYNRPFYFAPGLRLFYNEDSADLWFSQDINYPPDYFQRVGRIDSVYKGSLERLQHFALPEGVMPPRSAVAGYIYFEKVKPDAREVTLVWEPQTPTGKTISKLSIGYRRR